MCSIAPLFFVLFMFGLLVLPVQMTRKVPEARFATESAVYEDVETADAEEGRVSLTARKDVEGRMAESDVADDIGWLQKVPQCHGRQVIRNVAHKASHSG